GRGRSAGRRAARGDALEPLQPRVEVEIEIALALLDLLVLVAEHFELAAQLGDLRVHLVELANQLDHADVADAFLEARDARLVVTPLLRQLLAELLDAPARLVVIEEAGMRRCGRGGRKRTRQRETAPAGRVATIHPRT